MSLLAYYNKTLFNYILLYNYFCKKNLHYYLTNILEKEYNILCWSGITGEYECIIGKLDHVIDKYGTIYEGDYLNYLIDNFSKKEVKDPEYRGFGFTFRLKDGTLYKYSLAYNTYASLGSVNQLWVFYE
jgi:hypothetical protein